MGRRTVGRTDRWMDGRLNGRMDRWTDGWTDRWMNEQIEGWMDSQLLLEVSPLLGPLPHPYFTYLPSIKDGAVGTALHIMLLAKGPIGQEGWVLRA